MTLTSSKLSYSLDGKVAARRAARPLGVERLIYARDQIQRLPLTERYRRDHPPSELIERLKRKQLVFCITAGRTGSVYLKRLLEMFPEAAAYHEPEPAFQRFLRRAQRDPAAARAFLIDYKLPFIAAHSAPRYIETSHLFGKGFFEPLCALGLTPDLILLKRPPRAVALSYLERYTVPGRTKYGFEFLLSPDDPDVAPLPGWRAMNDYQLCFWYALEIERRQRDYARTATQSGASVFEATAKSLNDVDVFLKLCDALGLTEAGLTVDEIKRRHARISTARHNKNKRALDLQGDLDAMERDVWDAFAASTPGLRDVVDAQYQAQPI